MMDQKLKLTEKGNVFLNEYNNHKLGFIENII